MYMYCLAPSSLVLLLTAAYMQGFMAPQLKLQSMSDQTYIFSTLTSRLSPILLGVVPGAGLTISLTLCDL